MHLGKEKKTPRSHPRGAGMWTGQVQVWRWVSCLRLTVPRAGGSPQTRRGRGSGPGELSQAPFPSAPRPGILCHFG